MATRYDHERKFPDNTIPEYSVTRDGEHLFYCRHSDDADSACEALDAQDLYIEQLERIIYDCTSLRDFMLAGHSEDIYNAIGDKYEPKPDESE